MPDIENMPTPPSERDRPNEDVQFEEKISETKEHKGQSVGDSSSQAIKLIQEEEKKHKKEDDHLIKILVNFIKKDTNPEVIELVNKLLERNVPAPFIVAMLSLAFPDLINALSYKDTHFNYKGSEPNEILKEWYIQLIEVSKTYAHRILPHIGSENNNADEHVKNMLRFVIIDFYNKQNIQPESNHIAEYVDEVFNNLVSGIDNFLKNQKKLAEKKDE